MRASARAGATTATVDAARTRPSVTTDRTARSGEARVLQLQRRAGNRAVVSLVQRKAGCGCGCGGACGGTAIDEEAPVQRAIGSDLIVKGKFKKAKDHPSQVFFDFNSAALDAAERRKIKAWVSANGPPAAVTAKASEEGGAGGNDPVARMRGQSVAAAIGGNPKPKVIIDVDSGKDIADYRYTRRVELAPDGQAPDDRCRMDPTAEGRTVAALEDAAQLAEDAAAEAESPDQSVQADLDYVFHASDEETASRVHWNLLLFSRTLELLTRPDAHKIGTPCTEPLCTSARAMWDPDSNRMVTCPTLWEWSGSGKEPKETLLHESVHAAIGGVDHSYLHEPMFPFLTTKAALANPDSYVEFARNVLNGTRTKLRPAAGGYDSSFSDEQQTSVDKAISWMIKNLGNTDREMLATYGEMVEGMKPGADPKHLASIQPERNILAKYFGGTAPPAKPKPEDKWILRGAGDHIRQLHFDSGSQPKVVHGNANGAAWSRAKNRLTIGPNFSDLSVQEQARAIEWALILSDPGIPAKRRAGYLELIDHESHDYSATEG